MAKLCPKGKAAAKRKFKVYPSAYANMYAVNQLTLQLLLKELKAMTGGYMGSFIKLDVDGKTIRKPKFKKIL
jgi:hypothetical protein